MNWASTFTNIEQKTKDIIFHARKTFLFYQGEPYVKKNAPDFDCPMGAHDSAEVCELVGRGVRICSFHQLKSKKGDN